MKFSMLVPCGRCGHQMTVETTGEDSYPDARCSECGTTTWVTDDGRVSRRAIYRAEVELVNKDWSLAIVLSAMSVECELAYLYSKWKMLEANLVPAEVTPAHTEQWEDEFRLLQGGVAGKLDGVTQLLTGETFCDFVNRRTEIASMIQKTYPNVGNRSWKTFFVEELFRKRNKILHSGQVLFGEAEAQACVRMATSLLQIVNEIDKERYTRFDEELRSRL
jgi:hypothetical protein